MFIKWSDPSFVPSDQEAGTDDYMVGYVWPDTKTIFPDFLKPETATWWTNELKLFHDVSGMFEFYLFIYFLSV